MSRPSHHANASRDLFQNPWQTQNEIDDNACDSELQSQSNTWFGSLASGLPSLSSLLSNVPLEWAQDLSNHGIPPTEVVRPYFTRSAKYGSESTVKATWLGHASFLVEFPLQEGMEKPLRVLFDPVFSDRAGPSAWTGIRRRLPPPCIIAELPEFQFILISHNHYDHLDLPTIQEIERCRGGDVTFLVPVGVKSLLQSVGVSNDRVHELDWWDEMSFSGPGSGLEPTHASLPVTFVCVPAQHTSGRNVLDRCRTLWCGWVVKQEVGQAKATVYHAGDTGYLGINGPCPAFREIGERCGPIDFAMLPIWRGGTLSFVSQLGLRLTHHPFLSALHASPADAVAIHRDVRSRHSLAMHFATFAGNETEALEPLVELLHARERERLGDWKEEGGIGAVDVGETVEISLVEESGAETT